jgi:hypothetical protein
VLGVDETELEAVVRQPKRLALFLYLLLSDRRFHRRDSLLALFWPDHDDEHARAAQRRSLHFLSAHLGPRAIETRGDEVGVSADAAWCDAAAFGEALRAGRHEDALALYRGDLLEGLHIASAPDVGRWLDDARARQRQEAVRAASPSPTRPNRLDANAAARWSARAAELADDEGMTATFSGSGMIAGRGASGLPALRDRLAATLDLEPSPALRACRSRCARASQPTARERPARGRHRGLPFTVRGLPELEYLREGMVDLLSASSCRGLSAHGGPYALLRHIHQAGAPEDAAAVCSCRG